jgi:uncharacterized glyoxalase superfamily protein PhnB
MSNDAALQITEVYAYLRVHDAAKALDFYARAFDAEELFRLNAPDGRIGHAQIRVGPVTIMLADEYPELGMLGPVKLGGTTVSIHLHVNDVDRLFAKMLAAGATVVRPPKDAFHGERQALVRDPFGHEWLLGGEIEEVSPEEMQRRYTALGDSKE